MLGKHGATSFGVWREPEQHTVVFKLGDRYIKHVLSVAPPAKLPRGGKRAAAPKDPEREMRRKWRALVLITKAKLELIAAGDSSPEREFLADTMLADGQTVFDATAAEITESYKLGVSPTRLLTSGGGR